MGRIRKEKEQDNSEKKQQIKKNLAKIEFCEIDKIQQFSLKEFKEQVELSKDTIRLIWGLKESSKTNESLAKQGQKSLKNLYENHGCVEDKDFYRFKMFKDNFEDDHNEVDLKKTSETDDEIVFLSQENLDKKKQNLMLISTMYKIIKYMDELKKLKEIQKKNNKNNEELSK